MAAPDQQREMESILADWRSEVGERMERRAEKRKSHHARSGEKGTREDHHPGFFMMSRMHAGFGGGGLFADSPGFEHLADAAAVLDNDQLTRFADYLDERREARASKWRERTDGAERRADGPFARKMAERFGVTTEDIAELRQAHRESGEKSRALHRDFAAGTISAELLRDGLREVRLGTEARAREVLGDEEFARLHERRSERHGERLERRAAKLDEIATTQADRLSRALRLDAAGESRIEAALRGTIQSRRALLEEIGGGNLAPEDVLYRGIQIEAETSAAIRATLSPEEAARFDTIRRLMPGQRKGLGRG